MTPLPLPYPDPRRQGKGVFECFEVFELHSQRHSAYSRERTRKKKSTKTTFLSLLFAHMTLDPAWPLGVDLGPGTSGCGHWVCAAIPTPPE